MRALAAWQCGWSRVTSGGVGTAPYKKKGVNNGAAKGVASYLRKSRTSSLYIFKFQHHLRALRPTGILGKYEKPQAKSQECC